MSYIATDWATGDTITAEKLNKLEQGVASAGGVIVLHEIAGTLNKKAGEIKSGLEAGAIFTLPISDTEAGEVMLYTCGGSYEGQDGTHFGFSTGGASVAAVAASDDDYPVLSE